MIAAIALAYSALSGEPANAQATDESAASDATMLEKAAEQVVEVIRGEAQPEEAFAPGFLAAVPREQFAAISAQLTGQFGPIIGVEKVEASSQYAGTIYLRFEKAIGSGNFVIEPEEPHRVTGLLLQTFEPIDDDVDKITQDLEALPGDVSVLFAPLAAGAEPILSFNPDKQLAIGSTFKLYVLATLAAEVEAGKRNWDDVIALDVKSFPSGMMQDWPQGSPVTLQTLASLMISISDNTATDQLVRVLGREAVEGQMAKSGHSAMDPMRPLLTTLDLFKLKGDPSLAREWLGLDQRARRAKVAAFEAEHDWKSYTVTPPTFVEPTAIETLEWFADMRDLAGLMRMFAEADDDTALDVMAINPSMPPSMRQRWDYIGYKGGSEPGVLNLTWLLRDKAGAWHMLAMSWNNSQANVQSSTFELLAQRIVALAD
ncbi:serine hydrolase [Erythrobacter litoralis]|nr:serine hydrolase [Erythrobacter litoralis]